MSRLLDTPWGHVGAVLAIIGALCLLLLVSGGLEFLK